MSFDVRSRVHAPGPACVRMNERVHVCVHAGLALGTIRACDKWGYDKEKQGPAGERCLHGHIEHIKHIKHI